jgi:outer membrane protein insertion porin family
LPLPLLSSVDEGLRVTIPIVEGKVYRLGEFTVEGNSIFSEDQIRAVIGLNKGDIANGEKVSKGLFENLKKFYGQQGFIEYTAEPVPTFKDNPQNPNEGIVDFTVTIEEGKQFTLRRLEFVGNTFTRDNVLRREVLINEGDIYNDAYWEYSIVKLNQTGYFDPIDKDKDVDRRTNDEEAAVDLSLKVSERGRQQISFNGGISGIGGSFFGLEYSTNNLLGRGEVLSFNVAAGNRQRSFQFSFTEPYIRDRPISAGFSVFAFSQQFFGEGTFLSQNVVAQEDLLGSQFNFNTVDEENLFTRESYGGSIFLSSPLSEFYRKRRFTQFSRVGASYQLSLSSVKDPEANTDPNNPSRFIPVIYSQPNILTSRITGTFTYDTRNASVDPTHGREISTALALAGLGGDVRTYQPTISYTQFIPVRRKRSEHPEVFGFRIIAGTVGSFATSDKVRNANSLAFVDGVPIFERFFLGDEFTIRGYNVRSISPISPVDTFITSQNVVVAENAAGEPTVIPSLQGAASLGTFTGVSGNNVAALPRSFTSVGGDTQVLANLEYRIPIIGNTVSVAAFADIGSAFNIRTKSDQTFSSNFLDDQPFLSTVGVLQCPRFVLPVAISLSTLALCNNNNLAASPFGGLVARDNRIVTVAELEDAQGGGVSPITLLPPGFQTVFLRGEAQTNSVVKLSESLFAGIGDYRSSLGMEVRVQVPVINVPFRLIFAYNPNARPNQIIDGFPFFFNEKKRVIRFSVGRTF